MGDLGLYMYDVLAPESVMCHQSESQADAGMYGDR